jgi:xylitol oxidase
VTAQLRNWSGTYQFTAREVITARTVTDVQRAVSAGGRVRALGTRHSFNDLADNGATLVSVTGIAPDPVIDAAAGTVTAGAGMSYGALAAWLQDRGWALHNLGSLPHISVAGATATGTHGSGSGNQILSAALAGLQYVGADGELRQADRSDPGFAGLPVGLGAFGIVTRVTLDIQPSYLIRQDAYTAVPWDRVLADLEPVLGAAYSVSLFTDWSGESLRAAWVKRRVEDAAEATADSTVADSTVPDEFFGARREPGPVRFIDAPADNLTILGTAGPWAQRLPHFRLDSTPSNGDEIQSEYFVDRRDGAAALEAVRRLASRITPLLMVSEIRSTAPDELWLSGSYGRPTMAIHFTWRNRPAEVDAVLRHVESALAPFAARPHWGKVSHLTGDEAAELYPRLAAARGLFERLDPGGRFSNRRLERLGVREPR